MFFIEQERFWSLDKSEFRIPPKLIVQIWDNDKFSLDDYLGKTLHLKLNQDNYTCFKCSIYREVTITKPDRCSIILRHTGAGFA